MNDADRLTALEILVEQLIAERCLTSDDPLGRAVGAREALLELAEMNDTGRFTPDVTEVVDATMRRVIARMQDVIE